MDELFDKDAELARDGLDTPAPESHKALPKDPKSPLEIAEYIIASIATARVGYRLLCYYAIRFKLKDANPILFRLFMLLTFTMDIALGIVVVGIALVLLIGFVYVVLRGINAWDETVHILRVIMGIPNWIMSRHS